MTDVSDVVRCSCGAALVRGALACSLCHVAVAVAPAVAAQPSGQTATADSANGPLASEPQVGANGFLASPPPATLRMDTRQFSRVQAGPMSFGWTGRMVITLLCVIPIVFVWFMTGGGLVNAVLCLPGFVLPLWFLRESWRRARVR
jgi:hypothetical protein